MTIYEEITFLTIRVEFFKREKKQEAIYVAKGKEVQAAISNATALQINEHKHVMEMLLAQV